MKVLLIALLAAGIAPAAPGQARDSDPVVAVEFSNPALNPSQWDLTIHPDGSAHFRSRMNPSASAGSQQIELPAMDREVHLSGDFTRRVFRTAARHNWFNQECDSHMQVAFQGSKKLSYSGPEGHGACTFNYSRDKEIQAIGDSVVGVAETILEGQKLEMLLLHDRLGLDREMSFLSRAVEDGQAQQVCAIRDVLEKLAGDDEVLERVRKQARQLLARDEP